MQWREYAARRFSDVGIDVKSPMRGKDYLKGKTLTNQGYDTHPLSTQKGIVARDHYDVRTCDVILMNLLAVNKVSVGSMIEVGWASAYKKPIITVLDLTDTESPAAHAFVKELSSFIVSDLEDAIDIAISILGT